MKPSFFVLKCSEFVFLITIIFALQHFTEMPIKESFSYTKNRRYKIVLASSSSIFAFLFFLFFQPFGINNYRSDEKVTLVFVAALLVFSILIFLGFVFCEFILRRKNNYKSEHLSFLFWLIFEILFICSLSFFIYNYAGNFHDFHWSSYMKHIFEMGSVLIFPILGTLFYFKHTAVIKDFEEILSVSKKKSKLDELVLLSGDYKKDQIALNLNSIVYIHSEDNYVSLNYFENDHLKRYLIRSTLTNLDKKLNSEYIARCNRSTLVNLYHLESSKQVSGKLTLKLKGVLETFKVSKPHQNKLSVLINRLSQTGN